MKRVIIGVIVLTAVLGGAIAWRIHAQNAALEGPSGGSGVIEGVGADLSARLTARVAAVHVTEGDDVEEGALLVTLECDEPEARLAEARARLEAMRAQAAAARAQAEAAARGIGAARAQTQATRAQIDALEAQRNVAAREARRIESLGAAATASRVDQAEAAATNLEAQARAARAQNTAVARQASSAQAQAQAAADNASSAERSVEAAEALVRAAEVAVSECEIHAPLAGVVERVYFDPGELVMPGTTVARVVRVAPVRATFYLPNADLGDAHVGQPVEVVADAYEDRTFEGHVRRVGLEAEFTPRNIQTRSDRDRLVYPVEVELPNDEHLLRPGMPVQVTLSGGGARRGGAR